MPLSAGWLIGGSVAIACLCLLAAWRLGRADGKGLRSRLPWAAFAAAILNVALGVFWLGHEATMGPAAMVLLVGMLYVAALAATGRS